MLQTDDCFRPDTQVTLELLEKYRRRRESSSSSQSSSLSLKPSYPILNVGFPKIGSTTLWNFFNCAGISASHNGKRKQGEEILQLVDQGVPNVLDIISSEPNGMRQDAHMQLDTNRHKCAFPQIQVLDEFHREFPNATFVLNFRPVLDWIKSGRLHRAPRNPMAVRWRHCENIPGLLCNKASQKGSFLYPKDYCDDFGLARWWCSHVKHIRSFVKQYPSHDLIELDLYHPSESSSILAELFQTNASCWGHANQNEKSSKNHSN